MVFFQCVGHSGRGPCRPRTSRRRLRRPKKPPLRFFGEACRVEAGTSPRSAHALEKYQTTAAPPSNPRIGKIPAIPSRMHRKNTRQPPYNWDHRNVSPHPCTQSKKRFIPCKARVPKLAEPPYFAASPVATFGPAASQTAARLNVISATQTSWVQMEAVVENSSLPKPWRSMWPHFGPWGSHTAML